ncbi:uncharacterized protein LOC131679965 [Topomyia yanbarensis]|uniref:uncharacterized protein LOC131679965 n=1 Tax=Topomyia yanbarensis TaxID=2498891 RepID=UPI00273B6F75|nr:uncharacterized protein LOC131679965 [Topomyia yanbarensis]
MTKRTPAKKATPSEGEKAEEQPVNALIHNRGMAQRIISRIRNILQKAETEQTELTPAQIKVYQKSVEGAYVEFTKHHQEIVAQIPTSERDEQDECFMQFVDLHEEVSIFLESWLQNFAPPTTQQPHPPATQPPLLVQQSLPRAIPTFDGRYEHWEKFKVMFRDVVDQSNESNRIKLYHLEKSLIGDAAGIIDAKTMSDGNYERAWQLLEERFEDKRRIVHLHIGGLINTKKLSKGSYDELRTLVESFVSHVENLKFLGQDFTGVSEQMLIYILARVLDDETKIHWESTIKRGELPTYDETIAFLKNRVYVLERCQNQTQRNEFSIKPQHVNPVPQTTKTSFHRSYAATTQPKQGPQCDFCGCNHFNFKCPSFRNLSISQRFAMVRRKHICFNCLRVGHRSIQCHSTKACFKCKKKHHTMLHYDTPLQNVAPQGSFVSQPTSSSIAFESTHSERFGNEPSSCNHSQLQKTPMLLTAVVNVRDCNGGVISCRALLDNGSTVNLISESMANRLGLERKPVCIPITGIGESKTYAKDIILAEVQSRTNNFSMEIECLVVPKVTEVIPTTKIDISNWPIPAGFKMADPQFHTPNHVDILIGVSKFFRLLKSGFFQMADDLPDLRETHFGWVVAGDIGNSYLRHPSSKLSILPIEDNRFSKYEHPNNSGNPSQPGGVCSRLCAALITAK